MEIDAPEDITCVALKTKAEPTLAATEIFALTVLILGKALLKTLFGSRDRNAKVPIPML